MAIALTFKDAQIHPDGNKKSVHYTATMSGTYPAGGYLVNNAVMPSATNVFRKIHRILFPNAFDEDGNYFRAAAPVNTDPTDPTFRLKIFTPETGGGAMVECATGVSFAGTITLIIEGVKAGGVSDSDTI